MIGKLRTGLAVVFAATSTLVLALAQAVVLKTGIGNPHRLPRLWHRCVLKALGIRVHVVGSPAALYWVWLIWRAVHNPVLVHPAGAIIV